MNKKDRLKEKRERWLSNPYITMSQRTVGNRTFVRARANWPSYPKSISVDVVIKDAWKYRSLRDPNLEQLAEKKILEKINLLTNEEDN